MRLQHLKLSFFISSLALAGLLFTSTRNGQTQEWFTTGINLGAPRIRLAAPDLPSRSTDSSAIKLTQEFNQVLWNDLDSSGIFDLVSKSMLPLKTPHDTGEVVPSDWTNPPANSKMLIFGRTEVLN